ncbi:MAG: glutamine-hydrolyzing carbamoyl-phosphate synthase small subunit [Desulfobacterium sp.]|jgi:carbamoyl-phosphate synthase small subunit|nr:glutamine-hydrolyzing carbamoyl-phosphate synthase small subunit [Desulfobacterium sp.]
MKALLALEDGRTFPCRSFTGPGEVSGEVVFNTSMTGYQEILTDPSYFGQMVTMTYPMIGSYGVCPEDMESDRIQARAIIVREYVDYPSNWRSTGTLADFLKKEGVLGVEALDTRALTRHIRNRGAMGAVISTIDLDPATLVAKAKKVAPIVGCDLVQNVTTRFPYFWRDNRPVHVAKNAVLDPSIWRFGQEKKRVAALDFGIKYNIIRSLEAAGCEVLVLPASTESGIIKALEPDGIFLSNGPGDPESLSYAVETIREILGFKPMFGICLGMQLMGLAMGAKTHKIKFGHRGGNQPVKNFATNRVEITAQNHGFAVDIDTLGDKGGVMTHINLNESSLEGMKNESLKIFSVQYHPEASPGPHDAAYLFNQFAAMMDK